MTEAKRGPRAKAAPVEPSAVADAAIPAPAALPAKKKITLPETTEGLPWHSNHEVKKESNPFTERDWRMWAYAWAGMAVRVVVVVGAIFSVYQFLVAREEKRLERSMAMVELWERAEYQEAQQALKQRLTDLNARYADLLGSQPGDVERRVYYDRIGRAALTADGGAMPLPEFQANFDRIVYFLNRLSFCIEGNLCSKDVLDAYFRDFAVSFWDYFSGYVAAQRKAGSVNYARPIERYVTGGETPSGGAPAAQ